MARTWRRISFLPAADNVMLDYMYRIKGKTEGWCPLTGKAVRLACAG